MCNRFIIEESMDFEAACGYVSKYYKRYVAIDLGLSLL